MDCYKDKKERQELYNDAITTAVNAETLNMGNQALDQGHAAADDALLYIKKQNEIKIQLVELLKHGKQFGFTDEDRAKVIDLQAQLNKLETPKQREISQIETQNIPTSYEQMISDDIEKAKDYGIDLSNPYLEAFSEIDKAIVAQELSEEFDLLRLDKYDYAFATFAGLLGGLIDALFVGTITNKLDERGKILELTDNAFDKMVMKYADLCGVHGDSPKLAKEHLEKKFGKGVINYDQRYRVDFKYYKDPITGERKILNNLSDNELTNFSTINHHAFSSPHSLSIWGLATGVYDQLNNKSTIYDIELGKYKNYNSRPLNQQINIAQAVTDWFGHCMSDVAGASGSVGRGTGLPPSLVTACMNLNFGKVPISTDDGKVVYETISKASVEMFKGGFDLRAYMAMTIPVTITETLVRLYWFVKQHFYYGKDFKESLPFGKNRELQRLLLIASSSLSAVDVTHAIVKGASEQNPMTLLMTINYAGLINLAYKFYMNFRLEHQHNKEIREHMQTDVRDKFLLLLEDDYNIFSELT